jgi:chromosome partitioning protein
MARILALANQKGGVAKTTSAVNLAAALVEAGQRVLLVDLDAQACATFCLGWDPEDLELGAMDVLRGTAIAEVLLKTADGIDLLPAHIDLAGADQLLASRPGREFVVRDSLAALANNYDWMIIDCSPSLGIITINALAAADEVIIPLQCETLSHRGVGQLIETITDVKRLINPRLRVLGILPTLYDGRTAHAKAVLNDLGPRYQVEVLAPITRSIRFAEAPAVGRSILATSPKSKGAVEYRALAKVVLGKS